MEIFISVCLAVIGAVLGSFGCAQVWRLRARQLVEDKTEFERLHHQDSSLKAADYYDQTELDKLKVLVRPLGKDRSECLSCHHQLAWYDLIPVVSWLMLKGRCRYCNSKIGIAEFLSEVGLASLFVVSFLVWPFYIYSPLGLVLFGLWLVICLIMLVLFVYDLKWSLLPFAVNITFVVFSAVFCIIAAIYTGFDGWSLLGAVALLGGLYAVFAAFGWAGFGDAILGLGLGLILADWKLAFLALFLANVLGSLLLVPLSISHKLHRRLKVPFGPFMIAGSLIALFWGNMIIDWFMTASGDLFTSLML